MGTTNEIKKNNKSLSEHTEEQQKEFKDRLEKLLQDAIKLQEEAPKEIGFLLCTLDLSENKISVLTHCTKSFRNNVVMELIKH